MVRSKNNNRPFFLFLILTIAFPLELLSQINNGNKIDTALLKTAYALLEKSDSLKNIGNYASAIISIKQAQYFFLTNGQTKKNIETHIELADLYSYIFDFKSELQYANQAINLLDKSDFNNKELLLATATSLKAHALSNLDNPLDAIKLFSQVLPVHQKHQNWEYVLNGEWSISFSYYQLQNFDSSKTHIHTALKLTEIDKYPEYQTAFINLLSVINYLEGDYSNAIINTSKLIATIENKQSKSTEEKLNLANSYKNLGTYFAQKGEYERALAAYSKVGEIFEQEEKNILEHNPYHFINMARILYAQQKNQEAIFYSKKEVSHFLNKADKENIKYKTLVDAYMEIAVNYLVLEVYDSTIYYSLQAIDLPTNYRKYYAHLILGESYLATGETNKSLYHLESSRTNLKATDKRYTYFLTRIYKYLSKVNKVKGNYLKALQQIHKSLILNNTAFKDSSSVYINPSLSNIIEPIESLKTLHLKAQYFSLLSPTFKDQNASLETYQLANQWIDSLQTSYVLEGSQLFWSKRFKEVYEGTIKQAYHLYELTGEKKYINVAFAVAEKSKALLLLEGLKDTESQAVAGLPDSLVQKEKDLKLEVAFYEKSLQTARGKEQEKRIQLYQSYMADKRLALGNLKEQMERDYPDYYQLKYANTNVSIAQLQAEMLTEQNAFIEYFVGDSTAFVFVIGKNYQDFFPIVHPTILAKQTSSLQQILVQSADIEHNAATAFQSFNQQAYRLYQSILDSAVLQLPTNINQLIISPDGALNHIPFEVLNKNLVDKASVDFGQLPYLLKDYQIHYAYSASLWKNNQQRQQQLPPNTDCFALAPPYEGSDLIAQRGSLQQIRGANTQLEGTGKEIQAIAQHFSGQFDWSISASEANFKAQAEQFGLLHLAMHGEVSEGDTRLIFTNIESDTMEDNYLYPYEIANLDLQAQLAVLSACETGLGEYVQGEGVMSLARSFMAAGVPSLVMSLWKVSDLTTSELMPVFYKNLAAGQSKKTALHAAKKRYLEQADLEYRHPYYWSGFVLLGDETSLTKEATRFWWYIGGGLLLGLLGGLSIKKLRTA